MAATSAVLVMQDVLAQRRAPPSPRMRPRRAAPAQLRAGRRFLRRGGHLHRAAAAARLSHRHALFVAGFQLVLERPTTARQWAIQLAIALGTAAVTYLVFERYLSVILPRGSWTGW